MLYAWIISCIAEGSIWFRYGASGWLLIFSASALWGANSRPGTPLATLGRWASRNLTVLVVVLGLTAAGLWWGFSKVSDRESEQQRQQYFAAKEAEAERERTEKRKEVDAQRAAEENRKKEEEARFLALPPAKHLELAKAALADGFNKHTRIGGRLDDAERSLHAIAASSPEYRTAAQLIRECAERRDRGHIADARASLADGAPLAAEWHLDKLSSDGSKSPTAIKMYAQVAVAKRKAKREEAEEARRREREEARQARDAARASEPSGLLCCDGSLSPSCSCGGSHRGCCSHHGGICGCE
jgi:hypothetical protein